MLRSLVLILLLVNGAFFAWRQGWLNDVVGVTPDMQHEPQRLAQQIGADKIVVVQPPKPAQASEGEQAPSPGPSEANPVSAEPAAPASGPASAAEPDGGTLPPSAASTAEASSGETPAAAPPPDLPAPPNNKASAAVATKSICVEAGPFTATEYAAAEAMLRPVLPSGVWTRRTVSITGAWLVYMGPYPEAELLQRKQDELKRIKDLDFEVVRTPANLAQGISLGRFSKPENAENQLETLKKRGIRTARIVNLRQPAELQHLRVPRADVDTQVKLSGLKLPQGKNFTACRP